MTQRTLIITRHAVQRYRERIGGVSEAEARAILGGRGVQCAAEFGAFVVRIGRARIILEFTPVSVVVKTVLDISMAFPTQFLPPRFPQPEPETDR